MEKIMRFHVDCRPQIRIVHWKSQCSQGGFQKGTMFWMSLCFSLTWDSMSRNGQRQGFMVAWLCIAACSPRKKLPLGSPVKNRLSAILVYHSRLPWVPEVFSRVQRGASSIRHRPTRLRPGRRPKTRAAKLREKPLRNILRKLLTSWAQRERTLQEISHLHIHGQKALWRKLNSLKVYLAAMKKFTYTFQKRSK